MKESCESSAQKLGVYVYRNGKTKEEVEKMKKKFLTIVLTVLLFLSAVGLGVSTVFRVDAVAVEVTSISQSAKSDAAALRAELQSLYKQESIFSVEEAKAKSALAKYPYFRMTEFTKAYPNRLVVKIVEDAETYAVKGEGESWYILADDGTVLDIRSSSKNRIDGFDNVLINGIEGEGERGGALSGDECWQSMLALCQKMNNVLGGIRKNVASVEVLFRKPQTIFRITMTEGVKIYIDHPDALTEQKAVSALDKYLSLSDEQRITGRILVINVEGEISSVYKEVDEFAS